MRFRNILSIILAAVLIAAAALPIFSEEADETEEFPEKYDLRDYDLVSQVKMQNPYGTCWGFAAIAASEISILAELRELSPAYAEYFADPDKLDLSELQLAWYAYMPLDERYGAQAGEGSHVYGIYPLNRGGYIMTATGLLASGVGPVSEDVVPYRNHEGVTYGDDLPLLFYMPYNEETGEYDWSVDESLHFAKSFELANTNIMSNPNSKDEEGNYVYNPKGTEFVKRELMAKRGVYVSFHADTSRPGQINEEGHYINLDTYAHYTYDDAKSNHAVCIIGWDDSYSRENFLEGHQPPADGAYIVKNSWGSVNSDEHNYGTWGADGSGYFYLSYYDKSISVFESYDYAVSETFYNGQNSYVICSQYDFMPTLGVGLSLPLEADSIVANVFTSDTVDQYIRAVSVLAPNPGITATVQVYLLNEGWENPTDGTLLMSTTKSFETAGYHKITLDGDAYIPVDCQYSIVANLTVDGEAKLPVAFNLTWIGENEPETGAYVTAVVNPGESFIYTLGDDGSYKWYDWSDKKTEYEEIIAPLLNQGPDVGATIDNISLKAYGELARELEVTSTVNNADELTDSAGDVIKYTITVTNPEQYEIKSIHLEDSMLDLGDNAFIEKLDAGESYTFDAEYTVTEEDIKATNLVHYTRVKLDYDKHLNAGAGEILYFTAKYPWYSDSLAKVFTALGTEWGSHFEQGRPVTRGDFVKALYLLGGNSANDLILPFDDISPDDDVADAAAWGAACGVIEGFGDGTFRPDEAITREQMCAMMYRYVQALGMGYEGLWSFNLEFPDAGEVSDWASEAVHWMVQNGIIIGTPKGLEPKKGATLAQYCTVLDRFTSLFAEN